MSSEQQTRDNLRDEVARLRERVTTLEDRIDAIDDELEESEAGAPDGTLDRYDGYVLDQLEAMDEQPHPRQIVKLYNEAGVRNTQKIKERHRLLKETGRIDQAINGGGGE